MHRHNLDFNASIDDLLYAMDKTNQSPNHPAYVQAQQQLLLTFNDFAVDCFKYRSIHSVSHASQTFKGYSYFAGCINLPDKSKVAVRFH